MISIFLLIFCVPLSHCEVNVKYAAIIYRHGDRTPVSTYPNDPWRNQSLWPVRFGELTNTGKRQHYALGEWLRKRYSHLLSDQFNPTEIYVRSTDVDRTLMSAEVNLAGMFPPHDESVWEESLKWQPIPVHTVPEVDDEVLAMKKHCVAYSQESQRYQRSKAYKDKLAQYESLMEYISTCTGMKVKDYVDVVDIYSTLYIESLYNFTLPNWTHSVYPDKMREPACYSFRTTTGTPLLARLQAGPLLKQVVTQMVESMSSDSDFINSISSSVTKASFLKEVKSKESVAKKNNLKLSIYSGHDLTIGSVLNALDMFDGNCPVYTATIFIELLYDTITTTFNIRISYRNSTEIVEPHILEIPYCGTLCPLERFIQLYDNLLTVNWEYECGKQFPPLLVISFFIGLGLFATIYVVHKIHFTRVSRQYRPHPRPAPVCVGPRRCESTTVVTKGDSRVQVTYTSIRHTPIAYPDKVVTQV